MRLCILLFAICFLAVSQSKAQYYPWQSYNWPSYQRPSYQRPSYQRPSYIWGSGEEEDDFSNNIFGRPPASKPTYSNHPTITNEAEACTDCVCGTRKLNRIVNGVRTSLKDFPWLVRIKANGRHHCGGSLITRRHVVTAAHCVYRVDTRVFSVYLADEMQRQIKSIRSHAGYDSKTHENDIAIIELAEPVTLGPKVRTICLPDKYAEFTGKTALVAGWGVLYEGGTEPSSTLQKAELPVISNEDCADSNNYMIGYRVLDTHICAGGTSERKDTCQGDSGGPLEIEEDGKHILAGIVSYGYGCAKPGFPGLYTRVSEYLQWINHQIGRECLCNKIKN